MGLNLQKSKSGRKGRRSATAISEINMTPFIDVMLVLLIVFMVTAPLMNVGVPVNLPKTSAPLIHENDEPLTVTINSAGKIFIQESETPEDALGPRLEIITKQNKGTKIYIKGDKDRSFGDVMRVMGIIHGAGFTKVMLLGQQMDTKKAVTSSSAKKAP